MYDESSRRGQLQDAIPILSFAEASDPTLKIRMLQGNAADEMASNAKGQRVDAPRGH